MEEGPRPASARKTDAGGPPAPAAHLHRRPTGVASPHSVATRAARGWWCARSPKGTWNTGRRTGMRGLSLPCR